MKAVKQQTFSPITITLETMKEADWVWGLLDLPPGEIEGIWPSNIPYPVTLGDLHYRMWEVFNRAYDPRRKANRRE